MRTKILLAQTFSSCIKGFPQILAKLSVQMKKNSGFHINGEKYFVDKQHLFKSLILLCQCLFCLDYSGPPLKNRILSSLFTYSKIMQYALNSSSQLD